MKSLAERKKFRMEQRKLALEQSGVPNKDTGVILEDEDPGESPYTKMTMKELQAEAERLGAEIPKDKTLVADVREFVENYAKFKAQEDADSGNQQQNNSGSGGWKAGN